MKQLYNNMVAVLLLAGIILAACSEIEPSATEIVPNHTYTLRVRATKAAPATKSLVVEGSGTSQGIRSYWDPNDVLRVYDADDTDNVIATLTATTKSVSEVSDFEATLTSEQVAAIAAAVNGIRLEYKTTAYGEQDGTLEGMNTCDYSVLTVPASEISVSNNTFEINIDKAKFVTQQAIVQFKVEDENAKIVSISKLEVNYGRGSFTVNVAQSIVDSKDEEDYRYFVAIPQSAYISLTATGTDGRVYTYEKGDNIYVKAVNYVLQNGYYYPIAVRMHAEPMLGDPYYSDGSWSTSNSHAAGAQVVGIVVYLGGGAVTEAAAGFGHGLVMALKDATPQAVKWATEAVDVFKDEHVTTTDLSLTNFGGLAKTTELCLQPDKYLAAAAAGQYAVTVNTQKGSGWFLPSSGQWLAAVYGLCGADFPDKENNTWWKNGKDYFWGYGSDPTGANRSLTDIAKVLYPTDANGYAHSLLNAAMEAVSNDYDAVVTKDGGSYVSYWTSSVNSKSDAIRMNFGVEDKGDRYSSIKTDNKSKTSNGVKYRVRAFLAF